MQMQYIICIIWIKSRNDAIIRFYYYRKDVKKINAFSICDVTQITPHENNIKLQFFVELLSRRVNMHDILTGCLLYNSLWQNCIVSEMVHRSINNCGIICIKTSKNVRPYSIRNYSIETTIQKMRAAMILFNKNKNIEFHMKFCGVAFDLSCFACDCKVLLRLNIWNTPIVC